MFDIPTALNMQLYTNPGPIDESTTLRAVTLKAMYTAAVSNSNPTASITISPATGVQFEALAAMLQQQGFTVTNSNSGTFTVGW